MKTLVDKQRLSVKSGHEGEATIAIEADAASWLRIMNREYDLATALAQGDVRIEGDSALLNAFSRCFPR